MTNKKHKKVPSVKELKEVFVGGNLEEIGYFLHRIIGTMRRLARREQIDDQEFAMFHQEVDIYLIKKHLNDNK